VDVKRRFALAAFLAVLGVGLPVAAVAKKGAPWGFRGHRGVVVESTNDATVTDNEGTRKPGDRGTWLAVGDEVRAGRFSQLRGKLPEGRFAVSDGGVLKITDKGVQLAAGALEVTVPKGPGRVVVEIEGSDVAFSVRPGTDPAVARFLTDGKGAVFATVKGGSLENGITTFEPGQMAMIVGGKSSTRPAPASVELTAACDGTTLDVTTGPGVQVFMPGAAKVSDGTAPLRFDAPGAVELTVLARDVVGNVAPARKIACVKGAPPAPAPNKGPAPPKPPPK
jgi:hypothetical protein